MKLRPLLCLACTLALTSSRAETYRTDINPALTYYRALLMAPDPMPEEDRTYLESKKAKEQKLPEHFGKVVAESDRQFELVHQAAHATVHCDWGIDLSPQSSASYLTCELQRKIARINEFVSPFRRKHGS